MLLGHGEYGQHQGATALKQFIAIDHDPLLLGQRRTQGVLQSVQDFSQGCLLQKLYLPAKGRLAESEAGPVSCPQRLRAQGRLW